LSVCSKRQDGTCTTTGSGCIRLGKNNPAYPGGGPVAVAESAECHEIFRHVISYIANRLNGRWPGRMPTIPVVSIFVTHRALSNPLFYIT